MKQRRRVVFRASVIGCTLWLGACSSSGSGGATGGRAEQGGDTPTGGAGGNVISSSGGNLGRSGGASGGGGRSAQSGSSNGGQTGSGGQNTSSFTTGSGGHLETGGQAAGGQNGSGGQPVAGGKTGSGGAPGTGGQSATLDGGQTDGGFFTSSCKGNPWPAGGDPTVAGPFQVTSDKNVGPLAGATPDPVYGTTQQRFNVYRPADLSQGGYCHPIILWGNGHTDNPEPNPPQCVSSKYCGSYKTMIDQLASQGFVVIASLSTITSQPDPATGLLPQLVGMNWIVQQNDDPASPYYHHLDTSRIGAAGHSEGAFATSTIGSDPHVLAIATMAGATATPKLHGPALFLCGGQDTAVPCSNVQKAFDAITTTPVMLEENPTATHGSWIASIKDPYQVAVTAWMRVHLLDDTAIRNMFYGTTCQLCQSAQLKVQRKNMDQ